MPIVRSDTPARPSARGTNLLGRPAAASTPPPRRLSAVTYLCGRPCRATIAAAILRPSQRHPPRPFAPGAYLCSEGSPLSFPSCAPVLKHCRPRRPLAACPVTLPGARRGSSLYDRRRPQWWGEGSKARLPWMTSQYGRWGRGRGGRRLYGRRRADDYGDVAGMPRAWKVRYFLLCSFVTCHPHALSVPISSLPFSPIQKKWEH